MTFPGSAPRPASITSRADVTARVRPRAARPAARRPGRAAVLGVGLVLTLAACRPEAGTPEAREWIAERVTPVAMPLPADVVVEGPVHRDLATAAPVGGGPAVVGAVRRTGGEAAVVALWRAEPGTTSFTEVTGLPEVPGDVVGIDLAQDAGHLVLAGDYWDGSRRLPFVWTSTDGATWTPVDLAGTDLWFDGGLTVEGTRAHVLGGLPDGTRAVVTLDLATNSLSSTILAEAGGTERTVYAGVAAQGDRVVVVGTTGEPGRPTRPVAFVSTDGAATFAAPAPIGGGGAGDDVSGLTATPDGFFATGKAGPDIPGADPVYWRSPDGVFWTPEDPGLPPDAADPDVDYSFADPVAMEDGHVYVRTLGEHFAVNWHEAGGASWVRYSTEMNSLDSRIMQVGPESYLMAFAGRGGVGIQPLDDADAAEVMLAPTVDARGLSAPDPADATRLVSATWQVGISERATWWYDSTRGVTLGGDDVRVEEWRPESAAQWTDFQAETAGSTTVATGTLVDQSGGGGRGLAVATRPTEDGEWQEATGVEAPTDVRATALAHVGETWYVAGQVGEYRVTNEDYLPQVWESSDGLTFTTTEQDLRLGGDAAIVNDICALPDGRALAVGSAEGPDGRVYPAAWVRTGDGWEGNRYEEGGTGDFWSCRLREDDLLLIGDQGDRSRTWHTTDGVGVTEEEILDEGVWRGKPVPIENDDATTNWVAAGYLNTPEHSGGVVWFSPDGATWDWLPLPGPARVSTLEVAVDGADLVVLGNTGMSPVAWRIPDIAEGF